MEIPQDQDLLNIDSYVYLHPKILKNGRVSYYVPSEISNEEEEEYLGKLKDADPNRSPLEQLEQEATKSWIIKSLGDKTIITSLDTKSSFDNQIIHLFNIEWKGAHTIYDQTNKKFGFFYCGYGLKKNQIIRPLNFYPIENEVKDLMEFPEPNGEIEKPIQNEEKNKDQESNENDNDINNSNNDTENEKENENEDQNENENENLENEHSNDKEESHISSGSLNNENSTH